MNILLRAVVPTRHISFVLLFCLILSPSNPVYAFKGRDAVMIASGTLVLAGGITFVIKSTEKKKKPEDDGNKLEMKFWIPNRESELDVFSKR